MDEKITCYRKDIVEIDSQILQLVKIRMQKAKQIGEIKKRLNLPATNLKVEAEVIDHSLKLAEEIGLDKNFSTKLISMLIAEAVKIQEDSPKDRTIFLYDMFEKVKRLEAVGTKIIRLEVGEPNLPSPVELKDALTEDLYRNSFIRYASSQGLRELRETIAENLNQTYGTEIDEKQILITNGGKFAIFSAILSMISPGDHATIPEPTWPVYKRCVQFINGRVDRIHTRFEDSWDIDINEVEETSNIKPKLLILCNPNNPTGKVLSEKLLRNLVQLAKTKGIYLLVDEVYHAYSAVPFKSILQVADSNFIYANSFSKQYGMTGWRIGYAISDPKTIAKMQKLLQISITCVPEFIQRAALKALKMQQDPFNAFAEEMKQRIDLACSELNKLPLHYTKPDGGMYVFPKVEYESFHSYHFANKLLKEEKVAIIPGEAFGDYPKHFRISLGTSVNDIRLGIQRIGKVINEWQEK